MNVKSDIAWLESYAHDLMEEGDFDQEASRLREIATTLSAQEEQIAELERENAKLMVERQWSSRALDRIRRIRAALDRAKRRLEESKRDG